VKGIITHMLLKKSWRKISAQFGIPYLPVYQFYQKIKDKKELIEMLEYFCDKKIISYIDDERNITKDFLESTDLIKKSRKQITKNYS
jgi:hypothetical protein